MSKLKPKPFCLPSDYTVLDGYIKSHKKELYHHTIKCLKYGIENKTENVSVFTFDKSKYSISISCEDYEDNIKYFYDMFLSNEWYELCSEITKIKKQHETKETV